MYPAGESSHFDMEYYLKSHMPESIARLSVAEGFQGVSVERGVMGDAPGAPPTFVAMCIYTFDSIESFLAGFMPHAPFLQGDMTNYTDIKPIIQFNEVEILK